jgi:hypothetical protein
MQNESAQSDHPALRNVLNLVGFCGFGPTPKYHNILAHFGRFILAEWLD